MDYKLASWRLKREAAFVLRYRNVEEPRNDEVWEMIESGVGAADQ